MKYTKKRFRRHLKELIIISLIGVLFNVLLFTVTLANVTISVMIWLALSKGNGLVVDMLNKRISWEREPIFRVVVGIVCMLLYTVVAFTSVVIFGRWAFGGHDPMLVLRSIDIGDYTEAILITLIISMFFHGREFYMNWKEALHREEKLKNETLKTKFESLRNQVNPHFLFNSLNVLSGLVYDDQKKAVEFIRKMSDVYRYVLDQQNNELVSLDEELAFFNSYTYLQQIRFGNNLRVEVTRDGDGLLPPVAMQLLLENAIKHNIVSEAKPLTVVVKISQDWVSVSNNIQEKLNKDSTGIGLKNLTDRYEFLTDRKVQIKNDHKNFEVILPLLKIQP